MNTTGSEKKRRQTKKTTAIATATAATTESNKHLETSPQQQDPEDDTKKKGRKPRGGKIITKQQISTHIQPINQNIILNLKCTMKEFQDYNATLNRLWSNPFEYNSDAPPEVANYENSPTFAVYDPNPNTYEAVPSQIAQSGYISPMSTAMPSDMAKNVAIPPPPTTTKSQVLTDVSITDMEDDINMKELNNKLKQLKIQLYKNAIQAEQKSACFWCTCDFDNMPCYIPKYEMDGVIYGYGSFCRPECGVAYLMKETIDDSTKFDRYNLLNQIYSKVYECKKNIKPAPDPHYLLDKFYGNLTIQEYRKLLKTEHLLLVVDKPLTRILPELHEDTDDTFTRIYGIKSGANNNSGVYKVKRQSEQQSGPSKATIIRHAFGLPVAQ